MKKNKVKVLHIGKTLSGVDTYIRLILKNVRNPQIEFVLITGTNESPTPFIDHSGQVLPSYEIEMEREFSLFKDILAVFRILKIAKKIKPNVIHAHTSKGGFIGRIAGTILRIPVVYTPHAFSYLSTETVNKYKFYLTYEKIFKHFTALLLGCSESEYKRAVEEVGYNKMKVDFWRNCINPLDEKQPCSDYIVAVGRPSYQKNTDFMIEVFYQFRKQFRLNTKLYIIGVGHYSPLKERVDALIVKYELQEYVSLIPWMSRDSTLQMLKRAYCYISTSRYEGLSYANIEALACGIPVIATKVDGNIECTVDSKTGYLVEQGEVSEYAERLGYLFNNPDVRESMSRNSILLFNEKFNIENNINDLEKIYFRFI